MEEWIRRFLEQLPATKAYAANTVAAYRVDLFQFYNFVTLTRPNVQAWSRVDKSLLLEYIIHLRQRGYSPSSLSRKIAALKTFFAFLTEQQHLASDPTETLDTPRVNRTTPRSLSAAEVERLLASLPADDSPKAVRDRALMQVLAATGLRVSELIALDLADVVRDTQTLRCRGERHTARELPVNAQAWAALVAYLEQTRVKINGARTGNALFLNMAGGRLTRQGLWVIVKGCVQAAGIDRAVTPYMLRHSFATRLLSEGQGLEQVQQLLGHSNKTTTNKYTVTAGSNAPAETQLHKRGENNGILR